MICPAIQDFLSDNIQLDYCNFESTHHVIPCSIGLVQNPMNYTNFETTLELRYCIKSTNSYMYFKIQCDSYEMSYRMQELDVHNPILMEMRFENNEFILPAFGNEFMDNVNKLIKHETKVTNIERILNLIIDSSIGSKHLDKDQIEDFINKNRELFEKEDKVTNELERIKNDFR